MTVFGGFARKVLDALRERGVDPGADPDEIERHLHWLHEHPEVLRELLDQWAEAMPVHDHVLWGPSPEFFDRNELLGMAWSANRARLVDFKRG